ncbi:MAG TPA: GNAT family N-acetyltransferase [bacterium]|nr:GNAT family N-acetyltransferase [bacterium]
MTIDGEPRIESAPATPAERARLLALMRKELASRVDRILTLMGLTWPQFEALYASRGEARTIRRDGVVVGYCWIEQRARELHLHAIFVLPEERGRGIGSRALRGLESEFRGKVDVIELGVEQTNTAAKALYERQGFKVEQVLSELGFDIMRKHLSESQRDGREGSGR